MKKIIALILLVAPVFAGAQAQPEKKPSVYQTIAAELLKDCTGVNKAVAVAGFSYSDGRDSRDGGVVAERITTELVKAKKFKVIERKEIEKVFEELKLQRSGAINPDSAKDIGKMLGADWMVVGTLTELPDKQLELNARLVGVESGEIINAANSHIKKDWLDQYKKLLAEEDTAIKKNTKDVKAFYERGRTNIDLAEYDSAIADFRMAIMIDPTYKDAYMGRGFAYLRKGEYRGLGIGILNNYDKAIDDAIKVIGIDSQNSKAYALRGAVYIELKEYNKAIEDFSVAIEIDPKGADVYFYYCLRGEVYFKNLEFDKAIEDYSKAIAIDPKFAKAYADRGSIYSVKGELDKAIEDYSKVISITPIDTKAYSDRGYTYYKKGEYDEAIKDCLVVIAIGPQRASAYDSCGFVYYHMGKFNKAIEYYSKAISINPKYASTYNSRGLAYRAKGEYDKALYDWNMALKLSPELRSEIQPLIDAIKIQ